MAHFAELNDSNIVLRVIPFSDSLQEIDIANEVGGVWKRTSYNTYGNVHKLSGEPYRFNYAGIGYYFDSSKGDNGAFIAPKPLPSWVLNESTCVWEPPISYPGSDGDSGYVWREDLLNWIKLP